MIPIGIYRLTLGLYTKEQVLEDERSTGRDLEYLLVNAMFV